MTSAARPFCSSRCGRCSGRLIFYSMPRKWYTVEPFSRKRALKINGYERSFVFLKELDGLQNSKHPENSMHLRGNMTLRFLSINGQ